MLSSEASVLHIFIVPWPSPWRVFNIVDLFLFVFTGGVGKIIKIKNSRNGEGLPRLMFNVLIYLQSVVLCTALHAHALLLTLSSDVRFFVF